MNRRIAVLVSLCLIVIVVASVAVVFYTTNSLAPVDKSTDADSIVWQTEIGYSVGTYTVADGKVFVTDKEGSVHSYNATTGESIWNANVDQREGYRPILASGGKIYVSAGQSVLKMDEDTGHVELQYQISSADNWYKFGKTVGFSIEDQKLLCNYDDQGKAMYDLASGQPLWSKHPNLGLQVYDTNISVPKSSMTLIEYVFEDLNLKAIDLDNGQTVWNYPGSSSQIVTDDHVILLNYASVQAHQSTEQGQYPKEHAIVCLNRATGQKMWSTNTQYLIFNPTVHKDTLLFASYDGCFYGLNINDGDILWKTQIADLTVNSNNTILASLSMCLTVPSIVDENSNRLYWVISSNEHGNSPETRDYYVRSLDLESGEEKWSSQLDPTYVDIIGGKKNAVLLDNRFFVKEDSNILCLDASSATVLWRRGYTQQEVYPLLADDKVIAVIDNYLVAYKP
jgi:outer membrane protein assembly factor BamB